RQLREPRVVDEPSERLDADAALADVLVPIDTARARLLRVVQVEGLQAREPHDPSELTERLAVALFRTDVVAGGEQVARVEADADAARAAEPLDDLGEVLEAMSEVGPLARRLLEQDPCS